MGCIKGRELAVHSTELHFVCNSSFLSGVYNKSLDFFLDYFLLFSFIAFLFPLSSYRVIKRFTTAYMIQRFRRLNSVPRIPLLATVYTVFIIFGMMYRYLFSVLVCLS
jgi:hypothetical protein